MGAEVAEDRVAFYVGSEFHRPILEPVYHLVRQKFPSLLTDNLEEVISFQPRVVVVSNRTKALRKRLRGVIIVWTRHGFASKAELPKAIAACDFACLSSEWVRDDYERRSYRPQLGCWVTGFTLMDAAFQQRERREITSEPTVLFAPTWEASHSAAPVLGENGLEQFCRKLPKLNLIIKPHPHIPRLNPIWMEGWQRLAKKYQRVRLVDSSANIYPLAAEADLLLSDVSSVIFYYLAFNRPIVLVDSPHRLTDLKRFDPEGPEWGWRDLGLRISSPDELVSAIQRCLANPGGNSANRERYRQRVFGAYFDGRASERIAEKISALLRPSDADRPWVEASWNAVRVREAIRDQRRRERRFARYIRPIRHLKNGLNIVVPHWSTSLRRKARDG